MDFCPLDHTRQARPSWFWLTLWAAGMVSYCLAFLTHPTAFFYWDEWSLLSSLSVSDLWQWLFQPHMGHEFPIGKLLYGLELHLFRDSYYPYQLTSIACHITNCILLHRLQITIGTSPRAAAFATTMYAVFYGHSINLVWGMQIVVCAMVSFQIVSCICAFRFLTFGTLSSLIASLATSILATFSFGIGVVTGLLVSVFTLPFALRDRQLARWRTLGSLHLFVLATTVSLYFFLVSTADYASAHTGAVANNFALTGALAAFSEPSFWGLLNRALFALPLHLLTAGSVPGTIIVPLSWILLALIVVGAARHFSDLKAPVWFVGTLVCANGLLLGIPALFRHAFGEHLAFADRYQLFALLPSTVFVGMITSHLLAHPRTRKALCVCGAVYLSVFLLANTQKAVATRQEWLDRQEGLRAKYENLLSDVQSRSCNHAAVDGELFMPRINTQLTRSQIERIIRVLFRRPPKSCL